MRTIAEWCIAVGLFLFYWAEEGWPAARKEWKSWRVEKAARVA